MSEKYTSGFDAVTMPYSAEAEQSVLGAVLLDRECMSSEGVSVLRREYFYLPQHQAIFGAMYGLYSAGSPIDIVTVSEELRTSGEYEAAGGRQYLAQLAQLVPSVSSVNNYAKIVLDKHYSRALISAARDMISEAGDPTNQTAYVMDKAEQRIYDIRQGKDTTGLRHINSVLTTETLDRLTGMCDPERREQYLGIPTGYSNLDRVIAGLNRSDLIIVGARPGMGKTAFVLNMARNIAVQQKRPVAVFSLEMSCDQLAQRLLSNEATIDSHKFRRGFLQDDEWDRLAKASELLGKSPIYLDDTAALTVSEMKSKLRRMNPAPAAVFVDYLQLMSSPRQSENRVQEVSVITRNLKIMAKELQLPVVVCSQLNRGSVSQNGTKSHRPQMSDLRDSGSIEQDADVIMLLYRPDYFKVGEEAENEDAPDNLAECIVAKNRHGSTDTVKFIFQGEYMRYSAYVENEYDN
ncbi:MAG: replicative DNA helicase [Clostridia bacterium]|nr:replicative DNA helicase [Clostridia bacterium]